MPTIVPVSLLRRALKVELAEDDPELVRLEAVAVAHLEADTGYSIVQADREHWLPGWVDGCIPTTPITNVAAVEYRDNEGTLQTLPAANWYIEYGSGPLATIRFVGSLPACRYGSVRISFTSGWAAGQHPANVVQAIVALVGLLFANVNAALPINLEGNPAYEGILSTLRCRGPLR